MAQQASLSFRSLAAANPLRILWHLLLQAILAASVSAQTPQQQYVFGSVPVTPATSQVAAYAKNGQTGALATMTGSPYADNLPPRPIPIHPLARFLFFVHHP